MGRDLQIQARALGDPTRYELFRYVADAGRPVGVAELTDLKGFNHNAIRQHLAKLVDAELLDESTAPSSGRGRPRLLYAVRPSVESRWDVTGPYERLSLLLSEVLRTGDSPVEVGRRAGARGVDVDGVMATGVASDPLVAMANEMARAGFEPRIERGAASTEIVLDACPFAAAALVDPESVCGVHLGLARGAADRVGGIRVDDLVVHDPRAAQCRLRVRLEDGDGCDGD